MTPPRGGARLRRWLASGAHGDMDYLARTESLRADPTGLLPGARSAIVGAVSYHEPLGHPQPVPDDRESVRVARYAIRPDYHRVLRRRMIGLGRLLERLVPGAAWRAAVDTSPILEKELAYRAGLGWIGRNTLLIHSKLGSELLLGVLLTDVSLTPGMPQPDRCNDCSACVDACPTAAIRPDRWLEARRCLSYLTIEHRGAFPSDLCSAVGNRLAGCDVCQQVCPWNRIAQPPASPVLPVRPRMANLTVSLLRQLDPEGWRELARGTPLNRLGFDRFKRNLGVIEANHDRKNSAS